MRLRRGHLRRPIAAGLLALLLGSFVLMGLAPAAAAQEEPEAITVFGVLQDPQSGPIEGATVLVRLDAEVVGEATTGPDGSFEIPVPGAGTYAVELDTETLPEGVSLRQPDRSVLDNVRVLDGRDKRVNFSFGTPAETADESLPTGNRYVNLTWSGIVIGLTVALASIGLSLVYGATGLVNFAHGEMVAFGALVAWFFNDRSIGPVLSLFIAGALAVVASGAFGAAQDMALWRRLERRRLSLISMMIVSIGLSMFLRYLFAVVFESSPRPYRQFAAQPPWDWGPLVFPPKQLAVVAISIAVLVVYALAMQRTRLGTAIRAVSDNRDLAESSGINVTRVVLLVWVVGSGMAGLGGVIYATLNSVEWDMGFRLLLPIFAAVILGGLGTAYGALVGGLVIGLVSELSTIWFPAEFKFAWGLAALIIVLIVRPQGILGEPERVG
ncbi:MAG: branched-chain amino acid ABC transporter permease [Acidimicrobiales bacterium]|nr:branched-chain amino acid ABC transporter permease [Acidimicrobiales bacterium]